jgi:hypothetical protein
MRTLSAAHPRQFPITDERDIVPVRQAVRQRARDLGLGLIQQAKIAAAISTVTRALIAVNGQAILHLWTFNSPTRQAFEVTCILTNTSSIADLAQLEHTLHFDEIRVLVDEATVSLDANEAILTLRMRLNH